MSNRNASNADKPAAPGYRLVACYGAAHGANGAHFDHCALCAPRWGVIERLSPETIQAIMRNARLAPRVAAGELARVLDNVLTVVWGAGSGDPAKDMEILRAMLRAYAPGAEVKT